MNNMQRLLTRIGALRNNLRRVQEVLQQADDATLLADPMRLAALKWHLLLALEDAFALCNQTVARIGGDAPTAYAECFERLAAHGILDADLSSRLQAMARFRNLLLHRYWEVDDSRVLQIARNELGDLERFVGALSVRFNLGA
jgi:uncharacterized protein YutE (UPF0331/DUF86 family)